METLSPNYLCILLMLRDVLTSLSCLSYHMLAMNPFHSPSRGVLGGRNRADLLCFVSVSPTDQLMIYICLLFPLAFWGPAQTAALASNHLGNRSKYGSCLNPITPHEAPAQCPYFLLDLSYIPYLNQPIAPSC